MILFVISKINQVLLVHTLKENEGFCDYKEQLVLGCIRHL